MSGPTPNTGRAKDSVTSSPANRIGDDQRENPYERGLRLVVGTMLDRLLERLYEKNNPNKAAERCGLSKIAARFIEILEGASKISDPSEFKALSSHCTELVKEMSGLAIRQARAEDGKRAPRLIEKESGNLNRLLSAFTDDPENQPVEGKNFVKALGDFYRIDTQCGTSEAGPSRKINSGAALSAFLSIHELLELRPRLFQLCATSVFGRSAQEQPALTMQEFVSFIGRDSSKAYAKFDALGALGGSPIRTATLIDPDSGSLIACLLIPKASFTEFEDLIKSSIDQSLSQMGLPNGSLRPTLWYQEVGATQAVGFRIALDANSENTIERDGASIRGLIKAVIEGKQSEVNLLTSHSARVKLHNCERPLKIDLALGLLRNRDESSSVVRLFNEALSLKPTTDEELTLKISKCPFQPDKPRAREQYNISWEIAPLETSYLDRLKMLQRNGSISEFWNSVNHFFISLMSKHRANKSMMDALQSLSTKVCFGHVDPLGLFFSEKSEKQGEVFSQLNELVSRFLEHPGRSSLPKPSLFLTSDALKNNLICVYLTYPDLALMARGKINTASGLAHMKALSEGASRLTGKIVTSLSVGIPELLATNTQPSGHLRGLLNLFESQLELSDDKFAVATWDFFMRNPRIPDKLAVLKFLVDYIEGYGLPGANAGA